jgi:predicted secreted Zn-dependent protease
MSNSVRTVIFLLCAVSITVGQTPVIKRNDNIEWNEFYKLQWHDFQGERGESSIGDAGTAVQIKAKPFYVKDKIEYDVYAYFNRKKSWSTDKSDALLAHEQLHFDIAEWYARKIRKKIKQLRSSGVNDVDIYNSHIRVLLEESNEVDMQYDMETLHGAMAKKQAAWKKKVSEALEDLSDYKKSKRVIGSR